MLSEAGIKRCTSGADVAQAFVACLLEPQQWWRILSLSDPSAWTRALGQARILLTIHPSHLIWLGQPIKLEWLHRRTLVCLRRLLALQHKRSTFFKTRISHVFTVHYERCTLNGLFEHQFNRAECWRHTVRFAPQQAVFAAASLTPDERARFYPV